jgi:predicted N-formylglutamate amidohydrolase
LSRWTRALDASARQRLLQRHYLPHRAAVTRALRRRLAGGRRAVHVAVHSFVPVLGGVRRRADVGLLYDPRRGLERAVCRAWRGQLGTAGPRWRVRCNYPYRGVSDGLTTALRRTLGSPRYAGIELEINQALFRRRRPEELAAIFAATLEAALRDAAGPSA